MKILLVDDDRDLVDLLRYAFQRDGHKVVMAFDGEMAVRVFESEMPDLVVLDLMMPKRNGMDVLKEIRRQSRIPVIVLSAVGDEDPLVMALESGADDYIIKPFRPRELRSRVRAALRRAGQQAKEAKTARVITLGGLTLDPRTRQVTLDSKSLKLASKEFGLLNYLMLNRDTVLTVSDIISNVWGYDAAENEEVVKVTIYRLRQKLEPDPAHPQYIVNVPGQGYKFQYKTGTE